MQLDTRVLQFISRDGWRCLLAIEAGMEKMEYVPKNVVSQRAQLRSQGIHRMLGDLMEYGLVAYEKQKAYEGYRLTWKGSDYIALQSLMKRGLLDMVGCRIGVGKEADVHIASCNGRTVALKIHRLGRTSFRCAKSKRSYLRPGENRKGWLHLSKLSAAKEHEHLNSIHEAGLPVPKSEGHDRHMIVMSFIDGVILNKLTKPMLLAYSTPGEAETAGEVKTVKLVGDCRTLEQDEEKKGGRELEEEEEEEENEEGNEDGDTEEEAIISDEDAEVCAKFAVKLSDTLFALLVQLAQAGVVHGDYNEFNIIYEPRSASMTLIDFPQVISVAHPEAPFYFERDVRSVRDFLARRFDLVFDDDALPRFEDIVTAEVKELAGRKQLSLQKYESLEVLLQTEPMLDEEDCT